MNSAVKIITAKKYSMIRKLTIETAAALLILLFLYAAFSKWMDMGAFTRAMHNQPFPSWMATVLVWTLPPVEITVALMLMFKRTQLIGFMASLILMILFTLYIIAILLHLFPRVPCSCGGVIKQLGWTAHLVFNLFFVFISILAIVLKQNYTTKSISVTSLLSSDM